MGHLLEWQKELVGLAAGVALIDLFLAFGVGLLLIRTVAP